MSLLGIIAAAAAAGTVAAIANDGEWDKFSDIFPEGSNVTVDNVDNVNAAVGWLVVVSVVGLIVATVGIVFAALLIHGVRTVSNKL